MRSRVAVIDYGMGNLHSVAKALEHVSEGKHEIIVTADAGTIRAAERVVFPGVGAIRDCMAEIKRLGFDVLVTQAITEKPVLAVCVGMQALFDHSEENNGVACIGVFPGEVKYFGAGVHKELRDEQNTKLKVPHMGWNNVKQVKTSHPMWHGIKDNAYFYFVRSYCAAINSTTNAFLAGTCDYGFTFAAAVTKQNVFATQFHPKKSHNDGLQLYKNFLSWDGKL